MRHEQLATTFSSHIAVDIEYSGRGQFVVAIARDKVPTAPIACHGDIDVLRVVRDRLDLAFAAGDTIEFSGVVFDTVDDAMHGVEIALGIT